MPSIVEQDGGSVGIRRMSKNGVKIGTQTMASIIGDCASLIAKVSMKSGAISITISGVIRVCAS